MHYGEVFRRIAVARGKPRLPTALREPLPPYPALPTASPPVLSALVDARAEVAAAREAAAALRDTAKPHRRRETYAVQVS